MNNLSTKIEAILFYAAEPIKLTSLAKTLEVSKTELEVALLELETALKDRGIKLINHEGEVALVTSPELSSVIEKMIKEERERDLGRAGIETLSIIAYKGPVSKKEIEYIRGVNSQYVIRNLLLRGLIERKSNERDERSGLYVVTADTLRHLGLNKITDLPEYTEANKQLEITEEPEQIPDAGENDGE
jgi:segregation and condensation protein B